MTVLHLTEENFKAEVLDSSVAVLVDFWAEWCGPCRSIAPVIEEVAKDYNGRLKVGKVNVDEAASLASAYGIMSIPTIIIVKGGKVMTQIVGALGKEQLKSKIDQVI